MYVLLVKTLDLVQANLQHCHAPKASRRAGVPRLHAAAAAACMPGRAILGRGRFARTLPLLHTSSRRDPPTANLPNAQSTSVSKFSSVHLA